MKKLLFVFYLVISFFLLYDQVLAQSTLRITIPSNCNTEYNCSDRINSEDYSCGILSFGNVEGGLSKIDSITVKNESAVPIGSLNVKLEIMPSSGIGADNTGNWEIIESADVVESPANSGIYLISTLATNTEVQVGIKFKPIFGTVITSLNARVLVSAAGTDYCYPDAVDTDDPGTVAIDEDDEMNVFIDLVGTASRVDINYVLALDESGSMNSIVVDDIKRIDLLKSAANYFVDLIAERDNANDNLAAVRFNSSATELITLETINSTTAKDQIDLLNPGGSTAIGEALELSDSYYSDSDNNVIILFTDGEENVGPPWMEAGTPQVAYVNSPDVYTIGMGTSANSAINLNTHANNHGGQYQAVPDGTNYGTGDMPIELQKAYLEIFNNIVPGMNAVVDPVFQVPLGRTERVISDAYITSSDVKAIFSVFDKHVYREYYNLEIRSPKGEIVIDGTFGGGIIGRKITGQNHTIFSVLFPDAIDPSTYVGRWTLVMIPKVSETDGMVIIPKEVQSVPVGFATSVKSDLQLELAVGALDFTPGNEIVINVHQSESGIPITVKNNLIIEVTTPDEKLFKLNGNINSQGFLEARFPHTFKPGAYKLFVRADVYNMKGEFTTREQTKYIAFSHPVPLRTNDPCISCFAKKILLFIMITGMLLLIILIFRKVK